MRCRSPSPLPRLRVITLWKSMWSRKPSRGSATRARPPPKRRSAWFTNLRATSNRQMKLAYFSPLTPQRSGISDYSEELLPYLAEGAEITLFVDGFQPANRELTSRFEALDYRRKLSDLNRLSEFDAVLYHMGNDHRYHTGVLEAMKLRPGVLVFHDFALQDFFLGLARDKNDLRLYLDEVEFCYGTGARRQAADALARGMTPAIVNQPLDFPLNARLAKSAEGIIV